MTHKEIINMKAQYLITCSLLMAILLLIVCKRENVCRSNMAFSNKKRKMKAFVYLSYNPPDRMSDGRKQI